MGKKTGNIRQIATVNRIADFVPKQRPRSRILKSGFGKKSGLEIQGNRRVLRPVFSSFLEPGP